MSTVNTTGPTSHRAPRDGSHHVLAASQCRILLSSSRVARVAFIDHGRPQLIVLNHQTDGADVLFATSPESRLAVLTEEGLSVRAVIEVDSASAADRSGWSVVAAGSLARTTAQGIERLPTPWRPGANGVLLRLTIDEISGLQVTADL